MFGWFVDVWTMDRDPSDAASTNCMANIWRVWVNTRRMDDLVIKGIRSGLIMSLGNWLSEKSVRQDARRIWLNKQLNVDMLMKQSLYPHRALRQEL